MKKKYFWYLIVGLNGAGVWLPAVISRISDQTVGWKDIPQNMAIYFVSVIVTGCADKGIELLERAENNSVGNWNKWISLFLDGIGVLALCLLLFSITILSAVHDKLCLAYILGFLGTYAALKTCWNVKVKEDSIDPANALGGNNFN